MNRFKKKPAKNTELILTEEYKNNILNTCHLGRRGFTILKSELSEEDLQFLKKDLYVKPQNFSIKTNSSESSPFSVFRENDKKIYIPRFYGIERYGLPKKCDIPCGEDINISFTKSLRDYQTNIVNVYMDYVNKNICNNVNTFNGNGGILEVPCGRGKTVMALKIISLIKKRLLLLFIKNS